MSSPYRVLSGPRRARVANQDGNPLTLGTAECFIPTATGNAVIRLINDTANITFPVVSGALYIMDIVRVDPTSVAMVVFHD